MDMIADCLLKAENYVVAAQAADPGEQRAFIRLAAIWRNRALRLKLALRRHGHVLEGGQGSARDAYQAA